MYAIGVPARDLQPRRISPGHLRGAVGQVPEVQAALLDELRNLWSLGEAGFGRLMRQLSDTMQSWRIARDHYQAAGAETQAIEAEGQYQIVRRVYDALAELYRIDPELGIGAFSGELGVLPLVVSVIWAVAGLIGSAGLGGFAWAQIEASGVAAQRAQTAQSVCAVDPGSQSCRDAIAGAGPAEEPGILGNIPWGLIIGGKRR